MSQYAEIIQFINLLEQDDGLRGQLKAIDVTDRDQAIEATIEIAASAGCSFSRAEYGAFLKDLYEPETPEPTARVAQRIFGRDMGHAHLLSILYETCHTWHTCWPCVPSKDIPLNQRHLRVTEFFNAVEQDLELLYRLKSIEVNDRDEAIDATVEIASSAGFAFSREEYGAFLKDLYEPEIPEPTAAVAHRIFGRNMAGPHLLSILYETCHTWHTCPPCVPRKNGMLAQRHAKIIDYFNALEQAGGPMMALEKVPSGEPEQAIDELIEAAATAGYPFSRDEYDAFVTDLYQPEMPEPIAAVAHRMFGRDMSKSRLLSVLPSAPSSP